MNCQKADRCLYRTHSTHDGQKSKLEQKFFDFIIQRLKLNPSDIHQFKEPQLSKKDQFDFHLKKFLFQKKELVAGNLLNWFIKSYKQHQNKQKWNLEEVFVLLKFILRQKGLLTSSINEFLKEIMHENAKKIFFELNETMEENTSFKSQRWNEQHAENGETADQFIPIAIDMESPFRNKKEFIKYISQALRENQCNLYQ